MSGDVYNMFTAILLWTSLASFVAAMAFLLAALVGWRTPYRKRRFLWAAGLFAATIGAIAAQQALLWWVFLPSLGQEMREARDREVALSSLTKVGDVAPEFSVIADDGSSVESENLRGKVVVLNFFATWCGPCILDMPHLQALWDEFGTNKEVSIIVVGREETTDTVAKFKSKHGLTLPMAADPERAAFNLYASERIPRTYVISRNGKIVYQIVGFYQEEISKLRESILRALKDSE